jgi:hypothetical protein
VRFEDRSRDVRSTLKHAGFDVNLINARASPAAPPRISCSSILPLFGST